MRKGREEVSKARWGDEEGGREIKGDEGRY